MFSAYSGRVERVTGREHVLLRPHERVGKYEILRHIGDGGMASIYLAQSAGPGGFTKPCAIKLLRPDFSAHGEVPGLLIHEASIAAHLHHPSIVQVFDLGRHGREYYMAMEWVDGLSLARLLAALSRLGARPPVDSVAYLSAQIAEALAYLKDGVFLEGDHASLVHRDVSPSNVLVSTAGVVKLTDFGIVKVLEAPTSTRVGVVKGKYAYMSPEQLRGDAIDHRSDIFSLGVVMFEALTCRRLFHRKTLAATVAAVHAARVRAPSSINPDVPEAFDRIVLTALAKRPDDRYADAEDLAAELNGLYHSGSRSALGEVVRAQMARAVPASDVNDTIFGDRSHPRALDTPPPSSVDLDVAADLDDFGALEREFEEPHGDEPYDDDSSDTRHAPFLPVPSTPPRRSGAGRSDLLLPMHTPTSSPTVTPWPADRGRGSVWPVVIVGVTLALISFFWWIVLS